MQKLLSQDKRRTVVVTAKTTTTTTTTSPKGKKHDRILLPSSAAQAQQQHRYDFDLTQISPRILAMGLPARTKSKHAGGFLRNRLGDVVSFLDAYYGVGKWRIINVSGSAYSHPNLPASGHIWAGWPDHHAPPLATLWRAVQEAIHWLSKTAEEEKQEGGGHSASASGESVNAHVVAFHCLAGRGRTGCAVASLLLAADPQLLGWPGTQTVTDVTTAVDDDHGYDDADQKEKFSVRIGSTIDNTFPAAAAAAASDDVFAGAFAPPAEQTASSTLSVSSDDFDSDTPPTSRVSQFDLAARTVVGGAGDDGVMDAPGGTEPRSSTQSSITTIAATSSTTTAKKTATRPPAQAVAAAAAAASASAAVVDAANKGSAPPMMAILPGSVSAGTVPETATAKCALDYFAARRSIKGYGVKNPAQQRYVAYVERLLRTHDGDHHAITRAVLRPAPRRRLERIVLLPMPSTRDRQLRPYVEILDAATCPHQRIFSTNTASRYSHLGTPLPVFKRTERQGSADDDAGSNTAAVASFPEVSLAVGCVVQGDVLLHAKHLMSAIDVLPSVVAKGVRSAAALTKLGFDRAKSTVTGSSTPRKYASATPQLSRHNDTPILLFRLQFHTAFLTEDFGFDIARNSMTLTRLEIEGEHTGPLPDVLSATFAPDFAVRLEFSEELPAEETAAPPPVDRSTKAHAGSTTDFDYGPPPDCQS